MTDHLAMNTPPTVSPQEWEAARQELLVEEKKLTRARDALAAPNRLGAADLTAIPTWQDKLDRPSG